MPCWGFGGWDKDHFRIPHHRTCGRFRSVVGALLTFLVEGLDMQGKPSKHPSAAPNYGSPVVLATVKVSHALAEIAEEAKAPSKGFEG